MNDMEKLKLLSSVSQIEAGEDGCRTVNHTRLDGIILTHVAVPNGKKKSY